MNDLEILVAARALITPPENWRRYYRKTPNGRGGFSHCALGAIDEIVGHTCDRLPCVTILANVLTATELEKLRGYMSARSLQPWKEANITVAQFNNMSEHATVLAWFDCAIDHARRQQIIDRLKEVDGAGLAPEPAERVSEIA